MSGILEWLCGRLDFSDGPLIMGVLNVTPDSFSDGGRYADVERAVEHGLEMVADGAAIIDVGPESSRPGSERVCAEEQISRAVPVIKLLSERTNTPISVDVYEAKVAKACLDAGAAIVNDISGGNDPAMFDVCAERDVPIVIMHMKGTPNSMQENPQYGDVVAEVRDYLLSQAKKAEAAGLKSDRIILDPGIGFGKTLEHNIELIKKIDVLCGCGYRVLLGTSRKRFIGTITSREVADQRLGGTIATTVSGVFSGVDVFRVHDVRENLDAVKMAIALK